MSRLSRRARGNKETSDLDLTTFLNLMVVLISFLLVTAVFSRITIQELSLPKAGSGGATPDTPVITIEVILRKNVLEVFDGKNVLASWPKIGEEHDVAKLNAFLRQQKAQHEEKTDATLLVESDIPYEDVIKVMDAVKEARVQEEGQDQMTRIPLFPDLSVGDAPVAGGNTP